MKVIVDRRSMDLISAVVRRGILTLKTNLGGWRFPTEAHLNKLREAADTGGIYNFDTGEIDGRDDFQHHSDCNSELQHPISLQEVDSREEDVLSSPRVTSRSRRAVSAPVPPDDDRGGDGVGSGDALREGDADIKGPD